MHVRMLPLLLATGLVIECFSSARAQTAELRGMTRANGRPVANAVVWLDAPNAPASPKRRVVLDQRNLAFSPHVLVVRTGTVVDFPNDDRVFHNVFSFRDGKVFDLGLYPVGTSKPIVFDHAGLSRIFCNIHPNMSAYVVAVDTPYFAVSNDLGIFSIDSLTSRSYTYHAWRAGTDQITGMWSAGAPLTIDWP
jgi:plastocyanin